MKRVVMATMVAVMVLAGCGSSGAASSSPSDSTTADTPASTAPPSTTDTRLIQEFEQCDAAVHAALNALQPAIANATIGSNVPPSAPLAAEQTMMEGCNDPTLGLTASGVDPQAVQAWESAVSSLEQTLNDTSGITALAVQIRTQTYDMTATKLRSDLRGA